eukprot:4887626-Ditylum_brightwellii.AAC.1
MAKKWSTTQNVNKKSKGKGFTSIQIPASWPDNKEGFLDASAIETQRLLKNGRLLIPPKILNFIYLCLIGYTLAKLMVLPSLFLLYQL